LKPDIRLSTAAVALELIRSNYGDSIPEYEGEFTDWWDHLAASTPRETATSRRAKRLLAAAGSPVFGPITESARAKEESILRELCFFDEHTWGTHDAVGRPYDLDVLGSQNEHARYAHHANAFAKLLLAQRACNKFYRKENGYHLVNTAPLPWSGWVDVPSTAFREPVEALRDVVSNRVFPLERRRGFEQWSRANSPDDMLPESEHGTFADNVPNSMVRFWVDNLPGYGSLHLVCTDPKDAVLPQTTLPFVKTDDQGWPISAQWGNQLLFDRPPGNFISVEFTAFNGRWIHVDIYSGGNNSQRKDILIWRHADPGAVIVEETPYTLSYKQSLTHPRLKWLTRTLEISKVESKARLTVRLYRESSELPEWFFIGSSLSVDGKTMPQASCGDIPFTPFSDQIPNTCRDFFCIDGWINYVSGDTQRTWISRDAPLVTFGELPEPLLRCTAPPEMMNSIYAMVYCNLWMSTINSNQRGIMEFSFDYVLGKCNADSSTTELAETILSEPVFINHAELQENELYLKYLHRP